MMKAHILSVLLFLIAATLPAQDWETKIPWEYPLHYEQMQEEQLRSKMAREKGIRQMTERGGEVKIYKKDTTMYSGDEFPTMYTFDKNGRLLSVKTDVTLTYNRDLAGRITSVYRDKVAITENEYDAKGRFISATRQISDTAYWRTGYTYGPDGKLAQETHYSLIYHNYYISKDRHGKISDSIRYSHYSYTYAKNGTLQSKMRHGRDRFGKDSLIREVGYTCDAAGHILQVELFSQPCPVVIKYSPAGELLEYTQCADFGRSKRALKTTFLYLDGRIVSYERELDNGKKYFEWSKYDKDGKLLSLETTYGVAKFTFNEKGLPVKSVRKMYEDRAYVTKYSYEYW
jgi:hypothetical protein